MASNVDPWPEADADVLPYETAEALAATIFPCSLCGGRVKPWCQPPGVTAHYNCTEQIKASLRTLASNLAAAGALCEAFAQGYDQHEHEQLYSNHGYRTDGDWRPGCQRPAP